MKGSIDQIWRNYSIELVLSIITAGIIFVIHWLVDLSNPAALGFLGAGIFFLVGHIYGRLKDRRESNRKRALDIFYEWHSKEMRESRIFLSRWKAIYSNESLPALSEAEKCAIAGARKSRSESAMVSQSTIDDPDLMEFHSFKIYQFFERWSLLVSNNDINRRDIDAYMGSYKSWYLENFIKSWMSKESDKYIYASLGKILHNLDADGAESCKYTQNAQ